LLFLNFHTFVCSVNEVARELGIALQVTDGGAGGATGGDGASYANTPVVKGVDPA
jgi:hypothetical protein